MECNYPTIHEFYRDGDSSGNRKIFVRIRVPRGMTRDHKVVLHSLTTQRSQTTPKSQPDGNQIMVTELVEGAPVHILTLRKGMTADYVLLIADETGDWSTKVGGKEGDGGLENLQYASTKKQRVVPIANAPGERNPLIQLVNPTTQITESIRQKLDKIIDGNNTETFTAAEKRAIGFAPSIRITTVGDQEHFRSAQTKKREGMSLTPEEERVWKNVGGEGPVFQSAMTKKNSGLTLTTEENRVYNEVTQRASELGYDIAMDGLRIMHAGPVWLVRQKRQCAGPEGIPSAGEEWCKNITPNTSSIYRDNIPYETIVPMKGNYPGACNRSHFDYDQGVCRMTAGGDFMLMGFDDGISVPILYDCLAEDLTQEEGETKEQFRARKNGTALSRGTSECKTRIPAFDTKSEALRHCETVGCTTIMHDELGKVLSKPWAATIGSTQMITTGCDNLNSEEQCQKNHRCAWTGGACTSGVTTSMATSIDRTELGTIPAPLCRFCDVPGTPATFGRVQRDNCCRCGGGDFRRFFSVPLRNLINPFEPYEKPKHAIEIINTGSNYRVGDLLEVASEAVPYAMGALVRVTKVHEPTHFPTPLKKQREDGGANMTCEQTCESLGTRCMSDDCGDDAGTCECGPPGDMRLKGGIQTVVVVKPGKDYESGAPLYRLVGGSGSGATLRIYSVDIRGGITYTPAVNSLGVILAASAAALGVVMFGGLFYRGYKKSAWSALALSATVALIVGVLVRSSPPNVPGTRKSVKLQSACADGEKLNDVTGHCEDETLTRLRKITDRY